MTRGGAAAKDWLAELKRAHRAEPAFYAAMDRQLAAALERATSEPASTFVLLPPDSGAFEVVRTAAGERLSGLLLNIDTEYPVEIEWRRVDDSLQFEWLELPAEDIREDLANRRHIAVRVEPPVPVEIRNPVWPHVRVLLRCDQDLAAQGAEAHLHALVNAWNADSERHGAIHNAGPLARVDEGLFAMTIDFGLTGVDALNALLSGVAKKYPLRQVILDC